MPKLPGSVDIAASRDGAVAARRAHNPKVGGSNPSPATKVFRSGGQSEVDPPVPIPNTEVKRLSADDTWGAPLGKYATARGLYFIFHVWRTMRVPPLGC